MGKWKDLHDIRKQKDHILNTLLKLDPEYEDYRVALQNYKALVEAEQAIMTGSNERSNNTAGNIIKGIGMAAGTATAFLIPLILADKAYDEEKAFKMKNGTIWNLIGKKFDPKN